MATQERVIELEGSRLLTARRRRGLTHDQLSKATGISAGVLHDWEERRAWCNSQEAINKLSLALKFPPKFFIGSEIDALQPWQVDMCRIEYDAIIICAACGELIAGDDIHDRHEGHEEGRPNRDISIDVDCKCSIDYHARCCPDCK